MTFDEIKKTPQTSTAMIADRQIGFSFLFSIVEFTDTNKYGYYEQKIVKVNHPSFTMI